MSNLVWQNGFEDFGRGPPTISRQSTRCTWELHQRPQGHHLLQTCGNYLLEELYVLNWLMSMT